MKFKHNQYIFRAARFLFILVAMYVYVCLFDRLTVSDSLPVCYANTRVIDKSIYVYFRVHTVRFHQC